MPKSQSKNRKQPGSKRPKVSQDQKDMAYQAVHAVKFAALLVLRNQGWGATRLVRFNERLDALLNDISKNLLSFPDIIKTLEEETGINHKDFVMKTQ